jgi:nicotinate-nucleotide adenylyltransferase
MSLDRCFFVPTYVSPFKIDKAPDEQVEPEHRLKMVELAMGENPHFEIEDFEMKNKSVSWSYLTVDHFKTLFPDSELFFLIGQDQANHFHKWKNWEDICRMTQLCIAKRVDETQFPTKLREELTSKLTVEDREPVWIDNTNMEVSSSEIRWRLLRGRSTNYLLPDLVYDYIKKNKLYI